MKDQVQKSATVRVEVYTDDTGKMVLGGRPKAGCCERYIPAIPGLISGGVFADLGSGPQPDFY